MEGKNNSRLNDLDAYAPGIIRCFAIFGSYHQGCMHRNFLRYLIDLLGIYSNCSFTQFNSLMTD